MSVGTVVDASVAVTWFVPEERWEEADRLAASGAKPIAPSLIRLAVANAFSKKVKAGLVTVDHAIDYGRWLSRFIADVVDHDAQIPAAIVTAIRLGHPIDDCVDWSSHDSVEPCW